MAPLPAPSAPLSPVARPLAALVPLITLLVAAGGASPALQPQAGRAQPVERAAGPPPLPVSARVELAASGKPVGVLLHDFDGDGRALLVAATLDPGSLHLWTTPLSAPRVIPVPDYPLGPVLLRLETLDAIAVASRSSEELLVYSPTAEDPAQPLHRVPLGARPHALGAGPLLSALQPSVVVATLSGELVVVDHRGTQRCALLEELPTFVAVEAGRVIVGSQEDQSVRVYELTPEGELRPGEDRIQLPGIPRDYLRVEHEGGPESWIVGGDGSLWRTRALEGGDARLRERRVGSVPLELEAMARPTPGQAASSDVVALSVRDLSYSVLEGTRVRHRGPAGQDPWALSCGDFDGDGVVDIALANRGARRVSIILGAGDGSFHEAQRVPVGRGPHALAAGDLDGDGSLEILVIDALDQELVVLGQDAGELVERGRTSAAPAGNALAVADVDGDGHLDVGFLVRAAAGARLRLLFGDGKGRLATRPEVADLPCGASVGDLWLGDLDGDGATDGLVADPAGGAVNLLGPGAGGLVLRSTLAVPTSPVALEVEGGRVFVALGDPGPRLGLVELELRHEQGQTHLAERAHVDLGLALAGIAVLRDRDSADWGLALLSRPGAGDGAGWLVSLSGAEGSWREVGRQRTGLRPYALATGDLDRDGYADVVVSAQNSHHVNLWRGGEAGLARLPDIGAGRGVLDILLTELSPGAGPTLVVANAFSNDISLVRAR